MQADEEDVVATEAFAHDAEVEVVGETRLGDMLTPERGGVEDDPSIRRE